MPRRNALGLLACLLLAQSTVLSAESTPHRLTFFLVPEEHWNQGKPTPEAVLPEGTIHLFRTGEYFPRYELAANEPGEIPAGSWHWIAEAPGFVSVSSGTLQIPEDADPVEKRILWPVVPACEIELKELPWRGVSRLDVVSLERGATYPIDVKKRSEFHVPSGRYLAYTVDSLGIQAFSPIRSCKPHDIAILERPAPPETDRQGVMASFELPDSDVSRSELLADLNAGAGDPRHADPAPDARIWAKDRLTLFFLDVPAEPMELVIRHPSLLTHRTELPPLGGGIHEIEQPLRPRLQIDLTIDYLPARPHDLEEITLLHCGPKPRPHLIARAIDACHEVVPAQPLRPGLAVYTFEDLDIGWYVPEARIDDERIPGLAEWLTLTLASDSPPSQQPSPQTLEEFHIFGHILEDDEAVSGEVRFEPKVDPSAPTRRFATDEELLFHIYYFAQDPLPFALKRLPEEQRERPPEELRGLFFGYQMAACDQEGYCRRFHHFSTLSGGGRMDLELDSAHRSRIRVIDGDTREPVAGARVGTFPLPRGEQETLHFADGELFRNPASSAEGISTRSDPSGEVMLRLSPGEYLVTVTAPGYRRQRMELSLSEDDYREIEIPLEGERDEGGLEILLEDGTPLERATLLKLNADGSPDHVCTRSTNSLGQVLFPAACLADTGRFLLLHPRVVLREISSSELRQAGTLRAELSRHQLRLRILDPAEQPLPHRSLRIRVAGTSLDANHFLAAASQTGLLMPYETDGQGIFTTRLAAPTGPLVEVSLSTNDTGWQPVPTEAWTETRDMVVDP